MGNRANVKIVQTNTSQPLYLYTHWNGYQWNSILSDALEFGQDRWDDEGYLTRILISRMYSDSVEDTSGGGVFVGEIADNEYPILVVDIPRQTVYLEESPTAFESFATYVDRKHPQFSPDAETIHDA